MKNILIAIGIILIVVVALFGACGVVSQIIEDNQCILENPRQVDSGIIKSFRGIFSSGPEEYHIYYRGKSRLSGKLCTDSIRVTKEKYEKSMYRE